MTYRRHGNVPTDADIAALGYKAFELHDLAVEVAGYWPDGDDEYPCGAWWVV